MVHLRLFTLYHLMRAHWLLLTVFALFLSRASAQDSLPYIDISKVSISKVIGDSEFREACEQRKEEERGEQREERQPRERQDATHQPRVLAHPL